MSNVGIKITVFLITTRIISAIKLNSDEQLVQKLFGNGTYDNRCRPSRDSNLPVTVTLRYDLNQIYEVHERVQVVTVISTIFESWHDYRLGWNASDHDDLKIISIDYSRIWIPDTILYNGVDMDRPNVEDLRNAVLFNDNQNDTENWALVSFFYNVRHSIGCRYFVRYFPFDHQNCTFVLGSWSHDHTKINYLLHGSHATTEQYLENGEWRFISMQMSATKDLYMCCPEPFVVIRAHLVFARRYLQYVFNLILPPLIVNLLSMFAIFVSEGNAENRHDKLQVGITALLSYCILLLSVSEQLPKDSSGIPMIGVYYIALMVQNAAAMCTAVYLSFPESRRSISMLFDRCCRRYPIMKITAKTGNDLVNNSRKSETVFMIGNMVIALIFTVVLFAIGLSR